MDDVANSRSKITLMSWLGRQVGHVRKAIATPVDSRTVYRRRRIEETSPPDQPGLKLRRTTIDEVIVHDRKLD